MRGLIALSPVALFLVVYLAVSIAVGDFYAMPFVVALLIASVWSIAIYRGGGSLAQRIETFSRAAGHSNIMYMIWIFILAGAFATLATKIGAVDATVNLTLSIFPTRFIVPGLFVASCLISFSIGTSVGTVVALTPLAVNLAEVGGGSIPFFVAATLGGAFFGDNLSFISDTTIAATRSQGCKMQDKFRANLLIVLPAATATLLLYIFLTDGTADVQPAGDINPWLVIPYLVIIVCAIAGVNVAVTLIAGIMSGFIIAMMWGFAPLEVAGYMGEGIDSMGNLIIITMLSAGMLGVIKAAGGINYLLEIMTRNIQSRRGAQAVIALLTGIVNLCTANNTVAIITVGGISREISERYGVTPQRSASLLDTASCIVQCLIPYGAQTLLATTLAGISPAAPFTYLYYPAALLICVIISIAVGGKRG